MYKKIIRLEIAVTVAACLFLAVRCHPVPETPDFQPELGVIAQGVKHV